MSSIPEELKYTSDHEWAKKEGDAKAISDVFSPVSGKVVEINSILEDSPELINSDPYGDGWIFKIEAKDMAELDNLMNAKAYAEHIESEE
jgi:glycine cleavage system H protein